MVSGIRCIGSELLYNFRSTMLVRWVLQCAFLFDRWLVGLCDSLLLPRLPTRALPASYLRSASAMTVKLSGVPPLLAISIARLVDSGLRATFCPAVRTCVRKYSSPYLWNTSRLFAEGALA